MHKLPKIPEHMLTIGVLGGIGPQATMDYERRIHNLSQQYLPQKTGLAYLPMLVGYIRNIPLKLNA